MLATLLDQPPQLLWSEIDWDPTVNVLISPASLQVMRLEADFLDASTKSDFLDNVELILLTESRWTSFRKSVHCLHSTEKEGVRHSFLGWALIRVSW
jgi:hypothetical protein